MLIGNDKAKPRQRLKVAAPRMRNGMPILLPARQFKNPDASPGKQPF